MPAQPGEEVLVIPRVLLDELGPFQGLRTDSIDAATELLLDPDHHFFMDRAAAEEDPTHKQLIPYCVIRCGDRVLNYTRGKSGGESRLHALRSVGVGGHINPVDTGGGRTGRDAYHAAVERELAEELVFDTPHRNRLVGLLNDDSNPVGRVHLGLVHLIEVDHDRVRANEDALADLRFDPLEQLAGPDFDRLETWSQACVRHLAAG